MGEVGNAVGVPAQPAFRRLRWRVDLPGVCPNSIQNLTGEVQWFEQRQCADAMNRVQPLAIDQWGQGLLAGVTKRRVSDIVTKAYRLGQVLVESESSRHRPSHLGDLDGMCHSGDKMVAVGVEENLSFVLQTSEGLAVNDSIPVSFVGRSKLVGILVLRSTLRLVGLCGLGSQ